MSPIQLHGSSSQDDSPDLGSIRPLKSGDDMVMAYELIGAPIRLLCKYRPILCAYIV